MKTRRTALLALLALLVATCQAAPIATVPASTVPAATVPSAASPAASVASDTAEIEALLDAMGLAVASGDRDAYLALVDLSDPVFALEHTRWVEDWSGRNRVTGFGLEVSNLAVDGDVATGLMTTRWSTDPAPTEAEARAAAFRVRFTRSADGWRYAGEQWTTTELERFVVRVAPGLEPAGEEIASVLPAIYDEVTAAFGYEPAGTLEIKLYADPEALVANTLLSLPAIAGWNEPGEALKLVHRAEGPPLAPTIAHELTHFLGFDRAGTQRSLMPWWLDEGIATYIGSQVAGEPQEGRLAEVIAWEAAGELAPWDRMVVFEETPLDLWSFVYSQGYAMVRFVSEELGVEPRNRWLAAMATEMNIEEATEAVLGRSFDRLDREFRVWLAGQR